MQATVAQHSWRRRWFVGLGLLAIILAGALAWASFDAWRPAALSLLKTADRATPPLPEGGHVPNGSGHEHAEEADSLALSPQARRNIGLKTGAVQLRTFQRSITVPAIVVERAGRTHFTIAAPMSGVVTGVHAARGEAVRSGKLLFTLRITHEDLVQTQTEFLGDLGRLRIEERELARLEKVASGAVAGRVLLERQYERDKIEARLAAQREALRLHGLTEEQVAWIAREGRLLREIQVFAPMLHEDDTLHHDAELQHSPAEVRQASAEQDAPHARSQRFVVQTLPVQPGQAVATGEALCVLADYSQLYLEGSAFEHDADELVRAAEEDRPLTAIPEGDRQGAPMEGLEIAQVANQVDPQSRALHFYVMLPNQVVRDAVRSDGRHFLTWKYKPGQRMQLRVPVETWENVLPLPVDAVVQEGAEFYVFVQNGRRFQRRPVHVLHRDGRYAVLANDGSVFPGETVALTGAYQLHLALKNQAGGGVDLHAGHSH